MKALKITSFNDSPLAVPLKHWQFRERPFNNTLHLRIEDVSFEEFSSVCLQ
ncbi:unnamed protein product [Musa acuminata var. zebrina]